jgi:hypothetical protein
MKRPILDFIVLAQPKCGTTSLYDVLKSHPDLDLPFKESFFFCSSNMMRHENVDPSFNLNNHKIATIDAFENKFKKQHALRAEVSTAYMIDYVYSFNYIYQLCGDIPLIFVVRNPIERMYSSYLHHVKNMHESNSFSGSLLLENERLADGYSFMWRHVLGSMQGDAIAYAHGLFSKVLVIDFNDLIEKSDEVLHFVFNYLGVKSYLIQMPHLNKGGELKNALLQQFIIKESNFKKSLRPFFRFLFPNSYTRKKIRSFFKSINVKKSKQTNIEIPESLKELLQKDYQKTLKYIHKF